MWKGTFKLIANTFLNQHNLQLYSKYFTLFAQMSVIFITHQGRFSLQWMETITENHKQSTQ